MRECPAERGVLLEVGRENQERTSERVWNYLEHEAQHSSVLQSFEFSQILSKEVSTIISFYLIVVFGIFADLGVGGA